MAYIKWILIALLTLGILTFGAGYYVASRAGVQVDEAESAKSDGKDRKSEKKASVDPKVRNAKLKARLAAQGPKGVYIIVDTGANVLYLMKDGELVRKCVISSGSGNVLEDTSAGRKWVFDTPRGEFSVKSKALAPNWIKPDWAFVEEGEAAPKSYKDRVEEGVLGDYALGFGNGYFIHGTLYTRMLGRNVTHGCVRVGDADLEVVFKAAPIGAKIYIF